jgi:hypothetical protein
VAYVAERPDKDNGVNLRTWLQLQGAESQQQQIVQLCQEVAAEAFI